VAPISADVIIIERLEPIIATIGNKEVVVVLLKNIHKFKLFFKKIRTRKGIKILC